jgi:hypothetical protein
MKTISEISHETLRLVEIMSAMNISQEMTFKQASALAGFAVTSALPAYQRAKTKAAKQHGVVIDAIRGVGFRRLAGDEIVSARGARRTTQIRRSARRGHREMSIAMSSANLDEAHHQSCSDLLTRFALIQDTSRMPKTNRRVTDTPPTA